MAGLIQSFRWTILSRQLRTLFAPLQILLESQPQHPVVAPSSQLRSTQVQRRFYVGEMRKSAFEGNILRLLRNEIQYELDRCPPQQVASEFNGFTVDERPGEQWVRLEKRFGDGEEIKVEVTMFDGSVPVSKPGGGKSAQIGEEEMLHLTLIVSIFKDDLEKVLEFICSAWPDAVEIDNIYMRDRGKMPNQPYKGPSFKDLDDSLQNSLYEFLEERGVDDALCNFLHKYVINKERSEYLRWMRTLKSVVEQKTP